MTENFVFAGAFPDCIHAIKNIEDTAPGIVLMDIDMPGMSGIEAVKLIKNKYPRLNILMLTVFEDDNKIFEALRADADDYILKKTPVSKILDAIKEMKRGGSHMSETTAEKVIQFFAAQNKSLQNEYALSPRETEVLTYLVNGHSYKMVAADMYITLETVRSHIKNIYDKLHVHSKSEAVVKAIKDRLV